MGMLVRFCVAGEVTGEVDNAKGVGGGEGMALAGSKFGALGRREGGPVGLRVVSREGAISLENTARKSNVLLAVLIVRTHLSICTMRMRRKSLDQILWNWAKHSRQTVDMNRLYAFLL